MKEERKQKPVSIGGQAVMEGVMMRGKTAQATAVRAESNRILIETDSPYLSPEPNRGKRNDSRNVKFVAQKIADIKGLSLEDVAKITYENAMRIFEI